jgi:hypothetical protein
MASADAATASSKATRRISTTYVTFFSLLTFFSFLFLVTLRVAQKNVGTRIVKIEISTPKKLSHR